MTNKSARAMNPGDDFELAPLIAERLGARIAA